MNGSRWRHAATAALFGCALSVSAAQAQDCGRHMLTGDGFGYDGLLGGSQSAGSYPRAGVTWDPDGEGPLGEVAVIAGDFTLPGLNICTWNGQSLAPIGEGLAGIVRSLIVVNGQLVAGGEFTTSGSGVAIAHLATWNGSSWQPFAGGADDTIYSLHLHVGELYAAGSFNTIGGQSIPRLARWDGSAWHAVGDASPTPISSSTSIRALETHEGELYAAGNFDGIGGVTATNIARWNGKAWSPLGDGASGLTSIVYSLHSSNLAGQPQLLVGGAFSAAGGQIHHNFARWDGQAWIETDTHFGGNTGPFRFIDFGDHVIAAGDFSAVYLRGDPPVFTPVSGFAVWDGVRWTELDPNINGDAGQALVVYNNELILGGRYFALADNPGSPLGIGRWAGPGDVVRPVGDDVIEIQAMTKFQGRLVAAGSFYFDDLRMRTGIAAWDGAHWRPFGSVPTPLFQGAGFEFLADDESLIVSRFPEAFDAIPANRTGRWRNGAWEEMGQASYASATLATDGDFYRMVTILTRWNGTAWVGLTPALNSAALSLVKFNGDIIACGAFHHVAAPGILRWNPDVPAGWSAINLPGGSLGVPGPVRTLAVFGNQLVVAGAFSLAFGFDCHALIIWDGARWLPFHVTGTIDDSAVAPEGVYLRGQFEVPGHPGFANLALWTGSSLEPVTADNPSYNVSGGNASDIVAFAGEAILFQEFIAAADGRVASGWTRITAEGGVPSIAQQPQGGAFTAGDTAQLSVSIPSGYEPVIYQWRKGKLDITDGPGGAGGSGVVSGATTASLTITNINRDDAGDFSVLISTDCGDVLSAPAAVGVFCAADFNHDHTVNSTDVSDFINAWFQDQLDGTFTTDVNHDGTVNSTDVSDFINTWFEDLAGAGCGG